MASVWKDVVLLTIRETASKSKEGSGFGMWVIQKLRDGAHYNVTVRAGSFYKHQVTGETVYPKDGMTDWDFEALNKQTGQTTSDGKGGMRAELFWDVTKKLIDRKNPPPVPTDEPASEPAPPASEEPEMPPW